MASKEETEMVRMSVSIKRTTARAYIVDFGGDNDAVLPQSLVKILRECGGLTSIELPEWLAHNEGMI